LNLYLFNAVESDLREFRHVVL